MRCSNCGWENPDGSAVCEKCNAPLQGGASKNNNVSELHSTIRENVPFEESKQPTKTIVEEAPKVAPQHKTAPTTDLGGTINPYAGGAGFIPVSHCKLSPIIFPGEDKRDAPADVCFKGVYNELNRANLDAENNTITSKTQATLTNKDGKWYIQDQSAQQTTYVRASEPTQLKTGDIILMGNRTFVFSED